jgi:hypothetical protein
LLDEYIGSKIIHFASFDIEGMEQFLIEGLIFNGTLTRQGVIFCQVKKALFENFETFIDRLGSSL